MRFLEKGQIFVLRKLEKLKISDEQAFFALTLFVGAASGLIAVGIHKLIAYGTNFIGSHAAFTPRTFTLAGLSVALSAFLTLRFFPETGGSGIPWLKVRLFVYGGIMSGKLAVAKFVTSILSLISGFSLGREGPTVSICGGFGSWIGQIFSLSKRKVRSLVAIGSAGGLAAAFNTPIAAVIFTMEEIVGDLNTKILGSIVISSVMSSIIATYLHGNEPIFGAITYQWNEPKELVIYLAVGVVAAFLGPIWIKTITKLRSFGLKSRRTKKFFIIVAVFLFMAGISLIRPEVLGVGHATMNSILMNYLVDWKILLLLLVLKFFATSFCYASGVSGGLFMPTLFIGACLGGLIGALGQEAFPTWNLSVGAFAIVGMGAYFGSVMRTPFTSVLMVFEMTRDYNIIIPLMVANFTALIISSKLLKGSIYENILEQQGIHLPTREDDEILQSLIVEDAMTKNVFSLNADLTVEEAFRSICRTDITGFPVLRHDMMVGVISTQDIGRAYAKQEKDLKLSQIMEKNVYTIYPDQSLLVAFHQLKKYHISRLPVVSRINDHQVLGMITAEDIVNKFGFHIKDEDEENHFEEFENELKRLKEILEKEKTEKP